MRAVTTIQAQAAGPGLHNPADAAPAADGPPPTASPAPGRPGRTSARAATWLGRGLVAAGLGMIPWLFVLAITLPSTIRAAHWPAAWVGLDGLEALGMLVTGIAVIRRQDWVCLTAAATATLLVIDAWFDITTSPPGAAMITAIAMAACPELPAAAFCTVLAIRNRPSRYPSETERQKTGPAMYRKKETR